MNRARETESRLDLTGGRNATPKQLRRHLASAPPPFLEGALENEHMAEQEMLLLLRNRMASPKLLTRIARKGPWVRYYQIKKALVRHPRTPLVLSRDLARHLFWKDLSEISVDCGAHPVIRRQGETLLKGRVEELTSGERIALARRASRGLIPSLAGSSESLVLRALLGNVRLIESDAAAIAASSTAPPDLLSHLCGHPTWGRRRSVRLAAVGNPRTPAAAALRVVRALAAPDLRRLAEDDKVPRIVRIAADRRLARPSRRRPGRG